MFAAYAALVKNLRGVLLPGFRGECRGASWLARRFRYREVGVPPSAAGVAGLGSRFRVLAYPVGCLADLVDFFEYMGLERVVAEALVLASVYISPVLMVGDSFLGKLVDVAVERVDRCSNLDLKSWRLHMRIATYSVLDMYTDCVEEALAVIRGERKLGEVLAERAGRISKDKARYWRISCSSGTPFLLYLDLLRLASGFIGRLVDDHAAGLAVVPVVYVPCSVG